MRRIASQLSAILDLTSKVAVWLSAGALVCAGLLIVIEITLRNVFQTTSFISVEYSTYLFVFMIFMALAQTQRSGSMIYMELIYDKTPPKLRMLLDVFRHLVALGYGLFALWFVSKFVFNTCSLNQLSLDATRTPLCIPQSVMVIGLFFFLLELIRGLARALQSLFAAESRS